jgi:hypothetical protein
MSSVFIQGNCSFRMTIACFPNFRVKTSPHVDLPASNIVPVMVQRLMVCLLRLTDCGWKEKRSH